jgi:hypothetical protein
VDTARADLVIQYVLAAAGERDGGEREVTVTQLVKYAYLADAAHAAQHGGVTFTGAAWTFTQLGPHAAELEARVAPVARRIGATTRATYYLLDRDDLGHRRAATQALPGVVITSLSQSLRNFSHDTNALLAHVYATAPLRRTLPGAALDFTPDAPAVTAAEPVPAALSPKARAALKALRARIAAPVVATPPAFAPRYDDDFDRAQSALDAPEQALAAMAGALTLDEAVWSGAGRRGRDVS